MIVDVFELIQSIIKENNYSNQHQWPYKHDQHCREPGYDCGASEGQHPCPWQALATGHEHPSQQSDTRKPEDIERYWHCGRRVANRNPWRTSGAQEVVPDPGTITKTGLRERCTFNGISYWRNLNGGPWELSTTETYVATSEPLYQCRETCVSIGHFFGQGWWGRTCLPGEGGSRGYEVPALKWPSQHSVLAQLSHPLSHSRTHRIAGSNGQGSKSAIMKYPLRPQTAVLWPKIVRVGLSGWFRSL